MYKVYKNIEPLLVLLSRYISKSFLRYRVLLFEGRMEEKKPPKRLRTGLVDRINDGGNGNGEEGTVGRQSTHTGGWHQYVDRFI